MGEVIEMMQILLRMRIDTYLKCKYILLSVSAGHRGTHNCTNKLFEYTDKRRPLLIGMKKGGAA